jgi:hypothetical protein
METRMTTKEEVFDSEPFENSPYVELEEEQVDKAKEIAKEISSLMGITGRGNFSSTHQPDILGKLGEYAFAEFYGLEPNKTVNECGDEYDYLVYSHISEKAGTIDVKTISFAGGDMLIQASRELKADVYFLVEKRGDAYGIIGYCSRSEAAQAEVYPPGEYSPVSVRRIPRETLHKPPKSAELQDIPPTLDDF